jgi:hypothetical protein
MVTTSRAVDRRPEGASHADHPMYSREVVDSEPGDVPGPLEVPGPASSHAAYREGGVPSCHTRGDTATRG